MNGKKQIVLLCTIERKNERKGIKNQESKKESIDQKDHNVIIIS